MMPLKAAQWDMGGIAGALRQLGGSASQLLSGTGNSIADYYRNMDPTKRNDIMRALMGAGAGATALGLSHAFSTRDPEDRSTWQSKALLGALLGGTAAYALPKGMQLLKGQVKLPNEQDVGVAEKDLNSTLSALVSHPGLTAGGVAGGMWGAKHYAPWLPSKFNLQKHLFGIAERTPKQLDAYIPRGTRIGDAVNGMSKVDVRDALSRLSAGSRDYLTYGNRQVAPGWLSNLSQKRVIGKPLSALFKIRQELPASGLTGPGSWSWLKPTLRGNVLKDPRARLVAAILGGAGAGWLGQKAVQGAV